MNFSNILISHLLNARRPPEPKPVSMAAFLDAVERGQYVGKIETLRSMSQQLARGEIEKTAYQKWKLDNLEGVTIAGVFEGERQGPNLDQHSGLCAIDIDAPAHGEPLDIPHIRSVLQSDPHIAFCFLSPGGEGLKAGIVVGPQADARAHTHAFRTADAYLKGRYGLVADRSGSDVSRVTYISYDADGVYRNLHATALPIPEPPPRQRRVRISSPSDANGVHEFPDDDLNARADADWWDTLLSGHGWQRDHDDDTAGVSYWTRPGKDTGISASVGWRPDAERTQVWLHVWSSNAEPLGPGWHCPFRAYAALEHAGDYRAASAALREQGYGKEAPQRVAHAGFGETPFGSGTFGEVR